MVGYDEDGRVLNYSGVAPLTPAEIATTARKVVSPSPLCWHARFAEPGREGFRLIEVQLAYCNCA